MMRIAGQRVMLFARLGDDGGVEFQGIDRPGPGVTMAGSLPSSNIFCEGSNLLLTAARSTQTSWPP